MLRNIAETPNTTSASSFYDIGVEDALLFQIMRDGVLGEERGLEADFGSDPGAFGVGVPPRFALRQAQGRLWRHGRGGRGHMAWGESAAAELGAEAGGLDLVELGDLLPGFVGYCAGDVNFQFHYRHRSKSLPQRTQGKSLLFPVFLSSSSVTMCLRGETQLWGNHW